MELKDLYPREGFGVTGHSVPRLVEVIGEAYGKQEIKINFPYHDFNMTGPACEIAESVKYKDTDYGCFVHVYSYKYMFYGTVPVRENNYLPIYSEADVYFVESINGNEINLIKGPCWREYL